MTTTAALILLAICATATSLLTEGIKIFLNKKEVAYSSNVLAFFVAMVVGCGVTALYYVNYQVPFNALNSVYLALMGVANWLGAMMGYDKVVQLIKQVEEANLLRQVQTGFKNEG